MCHMHWVCSWREPGTPSWGQKSADATTLKVLGTSPLDPAPGPVHARPESPAKRNKLTMGVNENGPGVEGGGKGRGELKSKFPEYLPGHPEVTLGPAVAMEVVGRLAGRREDGGD